MACYAMSLHTHIHTHPALMHAHTIHIHIHPTCTHTRTALLDKIAQVSSRSLWVLLGVGVSDMPTDGA